MNTPIQELDKAVWLVAVVEDFLSESPENSLKNPDDDRAFENPLVGFSRGNDPLYEDFKRHVGPFHWMPWEIFTRIFPDMKTAPGDLTVISWILPQTQRTKADNRKETVYPADSWARARIYGEAFNVKLREHMVAVLEEAGYPAVAPMLSPHWEIRMSEDYGFASRWSERHAAYASGLGTFGLSDGLITPRGKAMRTGSVVARLRIDPTPRPYEDHHAYCLYFSQGACGKCMERCPVGAITEEGHDKVKCLAHLKPVTAEYVKAHYGFDGYGCGLCQTKVPCESRIPAAGDSAAG